MQIQSTFPRWQRERKREREHQQARVLNFFFHNFFLIVISPIVGHFASFKLPFWSSSKFWIVFLYTNVLKQIEYKFITPRFLSARELLKVCLCYYVRWTAAVQLTLCSGHQPAVVGVCYQLLSAVSPPLPSLNARNESSPKNWNQGWNSPLELPLT